MCKLLGDNTEIDFWEYNHSKACARVLFILLLFVQTYWCRYYMQQRVVFPFSAIVSLDKLKLAILVNAVNPKIGGILIRGPKGSGKTTAVRGLIDILPKIMVVKDCPFSCSPYDPSNMCSKCSERYRKGEKLLAEERKMTVVNLPLGATEDRVVGSLDVEKAIKLGVEALEPGILAEANQDILYVDEVNLLPDHIADDLLDAAATGWNVVEREGISVSHPSRFIFVGTMNPEEGQLRPQLLDRFPLSVGVGRISSVDDRMEVVKRNIEFEENPEKFVEKYQRVQEELKERMTKAINILPKVELPEKLLQAICKTCLELKVDGMRPDIVISKTASALTAFEERKDVTYDDVLVASELALSHRTREGGFLEPANYDEIKKVLSGAIKEVKYEEGEGEVKDGGKPKGRGIFKFTGKASKKQEDLLREHKNLRKRVLALSKIFSTINRIFGGIIFGFAKRLRKAMKGAPSLKGVARGALRSAKTEISEKPKSVLFGKKEIPSVSSALRDPELAKGHSLFSRIKIGFLAPFRLFFKTTGTISGISSYAGKRAEAITTLHRGRPRGWRFPHGKPRDVHLPATIRAAARKQKNRERPLETALKICPEDVRENLRRYKAPMTIIFVTDLSGSMLFSVDAVKNAILKLHGDAYRYRDRVGIVALKDTGAIVVQHPITNLRVVANTLLGLRISGFTPLAAGMLKAWEVLKEAKRRDNSTIPVMVIITDGSANVPLPKSLETGEVRKSDEVGIAVREYEDVAVRDVMSVSKMIRKERIHTIIVNTNPHFYGRETYGVAVTEIIASITNGKHHVVGRLTQEKEMIEKIFAGIAEDQKLVAHEAYLSARRLQSL